MDALVFPVLDAYDCVAKRCVASMVAVERIGPLVIRGWDGGHEGHKGEEDGGEAHCGGGCKGSQRVMFGDKVLSASGKYEQTISAKNKQL
jgi:hypothetical protein